jgi:hypothetical protein
MSENQIIPVPKCAVSIRPATLSDLPFIDGLQKKQTKQVGWFPRKTIEGKIGKGHVLIAEEVASGQLPVASDSGGSGTVLATGNSQLATPVGYCIGNDQYFKRDDVGIIYQINIAEGKQRGLIGATLLKAQFERSAYGCKLYCCWCAQDIAANRFWEACGFVPLAFRAGSEKKQRIHIFWSKRIRQGDTTTPWWFPSETKGGAMMEDRLVFPIPPGTHWSEVKTIVLPRDTHNRDTHRGHTVDVASVRQLEDAGAVRATTKKIKPELAAIKKRQPLCGGLMLQSAAIAEMKVEKPKRAKKAKIKNDPKFVSAARELRDRWLEKVNGEGLSLEAQGKYEVSRQIEAHQTATDNARPIPLLNAA